MLRFLLKQTLQGVRRNIWSHIIATLTVSLAVLIFGAFLLILYNTDQFLKRWQSEVEVTAYLRKGIPLSRQRALVGEILALPGVDRAVLTTEEDALKQLRMELGENKFILEGLQENPLPASVEITVKEDIARSPATLRVLAERIQSMEGVESVYSGHQWVEKIALLRQGVALGSLVLGGALLVAVIFIISNTIKLTVYSREDEVEIMRLVGATDGFIRAPFILEGVLQGLAGTLVAISFLALGYGLLVPLWDRGVRGFLLGMNLSFFPWSWILALVAGGTALGGLASFLSLARFLQK
jgi:cell division transport system permease protein